MNLTVQQKERLERLRVDGKHKTPEALLEEMISLTDSIYAGSRDGYSEVVLRDPKTELPNGKRRERILVRKYIK